MKPRLQLMRDCFFMLALATISGICQSTSTLQSIPPQGAENQIATADDLVLDSVTISGSTKPLPNSPVVLAIRGAGLKGDDTKLNIFGISVPISNVSGDGRLAEATASLPSYFKSVGLYPATLTSRAKGTTTAPVYLNSLSGNIPGVNDMKDQRKALKKESKDIEKYITAAQRYAIDRARLQAVERALNQAQQPLAQRSVSPTSPNAYCQPDNAAEAASIRMRRAVMDPKEASDAFGRRIGRRFIVFQVTIENNNKNYQYMIHDVSMDLSPLFGQPLGTYEWAFSTRELSLLRGVPEKGQDLDPRNLTFHIFRAIGSVAGGVSGLTAFPEVFGPAVAAYNGPFMSSFIDVVPDHTSTQLNRLSDSAFATNTVIGKQQAKAFAVFVPESLFLTSKEQGQYWDEPIRILSSPDLDFRKASLCVDGAFITELANVTLKSLTYADPNAAVANATVTVRISGGSLSAGDTLDIFGTSFQIKNVSADGNSAESDVKLPGDFSRTKSYPATISSPRTAEKTAAVSLSSSEGLKLTSINFVDPKQAASNSVVTLKIVGSNLTAGDTALSGFGTTAGLKNVSPDLTSAEADIKFPGNYDSAKQYAIALNSSKTGVKTDPVNLPSPKGLTLTTINFADRTKAASNAQITLNLAGTNLSGDAVLNIFGLSAQLKNSSPDGTSAEADITLPKDYDLTKQYDATVSSAKTGEKTSPVKLPSARTSP